MTLSPTKRMALAAAALLFFAAMPSCGPGLCTDGDCSSTLAPAAISFAVSTLRTDQAVLTWSLPVGTESVAQTVSLYAGDNSTCSGTPTASFTVPGTASSATWNRFDSGLTGLIRFKVQGLDSVPCSGEIFLRNGVVTVAGSASNQRLGNTGPNPWNRVLAYADINGDGVKDIIQGDGTFSDNRGLIAISLSQGGSLTRRVLVEIVGQTPGDGLGDHLEVQDVTGDGLVDLVSGAGAAVYVIPGSPTIQSAIAGQQYGYRYQADAAPNLATLGTCNFHDQKFLHGDMNGDGLPEIVACAPIMTVGGVAMAGAFVVIPTGMQLPPSGNIETLPGVRLYSGDAVYGQMSNNVSLHFYVDDITGDGIGDLLYGNWMRGYLAVVPGAVNLPASGTVASVGRVWTFTTTIFLSLTQGLADVTGDGIKDWLIANDSVNYVIFGQTPLPASGALSARASRAYTGTSGTSTVWGMTLDMTGDGVDDLVFREPNRSPGGVTNAGSVYVLVGGALPASGALSSWADRRYDGEYVGETLGNGYFWWRDLDGDGTEDLVLSNSNASPGLSGAGTAVILFGGSPLAATGPASVAGIRYNGAAASDGLSLQSMFDVNGDGAQELIFTRTTSNTIDIVSSLPSYPASGTITAAATSFGNDFSDSLNVDAESSDINGDGFDDFIFYGLGPADEGVICLLAGGTTLPAAAPLGNVAQCFAGETAGAYVRWSEDSILSLTSNGKKDLVLYAQETTKQLSSLQLIMGASNLSNVQKAYATRTAWGDSEAPVIFAAAHDLDADGKPELMYLQPKASLNGFVENGAIHIVPGDYLYTSITP
jgi:hypothetical protein